MSATEVKLGSVAPIWDARSRLAAAVRARSRSIRVKPIAACSRAKSPGDEAGPNGGPMQDVAGVHAELIKTGNTVTINVFDEANKPTSAKGFTGSVLIVSGADRETVTLAPSGDFSLKGEAKKAIAAGASVTVVIKNAAGKSGQVKF